MSMIEEKTLHIQIYGMSNKTIRRFKEKIKEDQYKTMAEFFREVIREYLKYDKR